MSTTSRGGSPPPTPYYYRRELSLGELLPAIGVGVGAGAAAFYIARLLLERTPLGGRPRGPSARPGGTGRARSGNRDR